MLKKEDIKLQWFKEARFGLFIHWGLYSATEGYWNGKETAGIGEWIQSRERIPGAEYEKAAKKLTCERFAPEEWARLAKRAGMKYCVFTSKHHEGFSMFDTAYDDYSIVKRSPYGKDATAAVVEAMRKEKIVPCLYYSQALDFHEENAWGNTWDYETPELERDIRAYIDGKCKTQLKELLTHYGKLGMIWMDVPKWLSEEMAQELIDLIHEEQPDCLISGRITWSNTMGDFGCYGDNQIPAGKQEGCWETAATLNHTWGYKKDDHHYKSLKEILELLCDLMAKGTNLLLNIGARPDGSLTEETIALLEGIGDWYETHGEAISGTEESPFDCDVSFGGISRKDHALYLYVYEKRDQISLYGIENQVLDVEVLGVGKVPYEQSRISSEALSDTLLQINLSKTQHDPNVTVIKVLLDGSPKVKKGIRQQEKDQVILPAYACKILPWKHEETQRIETANETVDRSSEEMDDALLADIKNAQTEQELSVDVAGILQNWKKEDHCLQWEFDVLEAGTYEAVLYSVTEKYQPWKGGHEVHLETGDGQRTEKKALTPDRGSRGANQKYYAETGSCIGRITLKEGKNVIRLFADRIDPKDPAGLSLDKLILQKNQ